MFKKLLILLISFSILLGLSPLTFAVVLNPARVVPSGVTVTVPDQATDNSPVLEKVVFIHYKKDAKPPAAGGSKAPKCYDLSMRAKWFSLPLTYYINPTNPQGLNSSFIVNAISNGAETWDTATSKELSSSYVIDTTANWDSDTPDYRVEYSFGNYPESGVIAVTVVWIAIYPGKIRQIVDADVLLDTDFVWGDAILDSTKMDLQNIATHEDGHVKGLGDVYETTCNVVTMYGYSNYGETDKRTLEQPDITGLQKLYGA